jgi:hypothetical protein
MYFMNSNSNHFASVGWERPAIRSAVESFPACANVTSLLKANQQTPFWGFVERLDFTQRP